MINRGIATFTLDTGQCPPWLFARMVKLGRHIVYTIVEEYGPEEFVRRVADPVWFQSLGTVLAFDWNASGLTTILTAALKEAIYGAEDYFGFYIAGGKGKTSRKTPDELLLKSQYAGLNQKQANQLVYNSKMAAKVDSSLVQDGFQLYHHTMFFAPRRISLRSSYAGQANNYQTPGLYKLNSSVNPGVKIPNPRILTDASGEVVPVPNVVPRASRDEVVPAPCSSKNEVVPAPRSSKSEVIPAPRSSKSEVVWAVVQQGMNQTNQTARRYHWYSEKIDDMVCEPQYGIATQAKNATLDLSAKKSTKTRQLNAQMVTAGYNSLMKDITILRKHSSSLSKMIKVQYGEKQLTLLELYDPYFTTHPVVKENFSRSKYLEKVLWKLADEKPDSYESLLATKGVGPKTIRALSLVAEVIYGAKPSYEDPARYSFAHGGKDAIPYPVDRPTYDQTIEFFRKIVAKSKLSQLDKNKISARLNK